MLHLELSDLIALRPIREADAEELYAVVDANREYLAPWLPWAAGETLEGTRQFIKTAVAQRGNATGEQTAIVAGGAIVGMIGTHAVDRPNLSVELGYWLAEPHQGNGTMTRAVRAYTDEAFAGWGLNRVEIRAAVDNVRSRAVPERLGFLHEGTVRQAERISGRFHDLAIYGMLAADWAAEGMSAP